MSFAIIRNTKYKRENLKGIYRHNERRNKNYSNDNIDKEKSYLNYSLKSPKYRYDKEFDIMKEKYDLKGQIKTVSNIACEYIITSDKQFFEEIGEEETKRYFETAYQFVAEYKNLGEQYIMSAKVHMDEETPHMHLIFLPVVHTQDKKGNNIDKLACSEFWKEKDSYRRLQDAFYQYMTSHNFKLERGVPKEETGREHIDIKEYKDNVLTVNTLNKWGIVNLEDGSKIEPFYNSINIINSKKFIVELNDKYFLINEKEQELTDIKYDYMYYIDNYIVAIYNNKIDILNENLDSKLIMKIDTEYSYTNSNERNSLNINSDKEYIYFSVYKDEKYIKYKYSKERNAISY